MVLALAQIILRITQKIGFGRRLSSRVLGREAEEDSQTCMLAQNWNTRSKDVGTYRKTTQDTAGRRLTGPSRERESPLWEQVSPTLSLEPAWGAMPDGPAVLWSAMRARPDDDSLPLPTRREAAS